jgi:hypothetical protein
MASVAVKPKLAPKRPYRSGGKKFNLERERKSKTFTAGYTKAWPHAFWIDLWAILPPSSHAAIVTLVHAFSRGFNREWTTPIGNAYFGGIARIDVESIAAAINDLIEWKVIEEKEPGSCEYKCLVENWRQIAEERPYPRKKGPRRAGEEEEELAELDDLGQDEEEETEESERPAVRSILIPRKVFAAGAKPRRVEPASCKGITLEVVAGTVAMEMRNEGGEITVRAEAISTPQSKKSGRVESITSGKTNRSDSVSSAVAQVAKAERHGYRPGDRIQMALERYGQSQPGSDAGRRLLEACKKQKPGCTEDEVLVKMGQVARKRGFSGADDRTAYFIGVVPQVINEGSSTGVDPQGDAIKKYLERSRLSETETNGF